MPGSHVGAPPEVPASSSPPITATWRRCATSSARSPARPRRRTATAPRRVATPIGDRRLFQGISVLHKTARFGYAEICRVLLAAGAQTEAKTKSGGPAPQWIGVSPWALRRSAEVRPRCIARQKKATRRR